MDFLRWFPVAFLTNGVFIVTHGGIELTTPVLSSSHDPCVIEFSRPLHHGTTTGQPRRRFTFDELQYIDELDMNGTLEREVMIAIIITFLGIFILQDKY